MRNRKKPNTNSTNNTNNAKSGLSTEEILSIDTVAASTNSFLDVKSHHSLGQTSNLILLKMKQLSKTPSQIKEESQLLKKEVNNTRRRLEGLGIDMLRVLRSTKLCVNLKDDEQPFTLAERKAQISSYKNIKHNDENFWAACAGLLGCCLASYCCDDPKLLAISSLAIAGIAKRVLIGRRIHDHASLLVYNKLGSLFVAQDRIRQETLIKAKTPQMLR